MNSIRGKIVAGFLVMMAFVVAQYFLVDHYMGRSREQVDQAINHNYAASSMLSELTITGQAIRRYEKEYFIYHDDREGGAKYAKEWDDTYRKIEKQLGLMKGNPGDIFSKSDVTQFDIWQSELAVYGAEMRKIRAGVEQALSQAVPAAIPTRELNGQIRIGKDRFAVLLNGAIQMERQKAKEAAAAAKAISTNFAELENALLWVVGAGVVLVTLLLMRLPRAITNPIDSLVAAAESMSKGRLEDSILSAGIAEFVILEKALERMRITQLAMIERMKRKA
jgi:HAMP domain-containing protein